MADITSPKSRSGRKVNQEANTIRESMSSPDIMKNESSSAKRYIEEYLSGGNNTMRNGSYPKVRPSTSSVKMKKEGKKYASSRSPPQSSQIRRIEGMFSSIHGRSNYSSSKNPASSLVNVTSQDNLHCSPTQKSSQTTKKLSTKDVMSVSSTRVVSGCGVKSSQQHLSLPQSDFFCQSSKRASMIVVSSPYTATSTLKPSKGKKKGKLKKGSSSSKKVANASHANIYRSSSAIGTAVIDLDSGSKTKKYLP